jgi:hypothetical protein
LCSPIPTAAIAVWLLLPIPWVVAPRTSLISIAQVLLLMLHITSLLCHLLLGDHRHPYLLLLLVLGQH